MKFEINAQSSLKVISDKIYYFDPFMVEKAEHDADVIFITHPHMDHYSEKI